MRRKLLSVALGLALIVMLMAPAAVLVGASSPVIHVYAGQSIQAAIDSATEGTTIVVHPGIYNEFVNIGKQVTLKGIKATIDQQGGYAIAMNVGGISISGFTIKGGWAAIHAGGEWSGGLITDNTIYAYAENGAGIFVNHPSNLEISKNVIHAVYPVYVVPGASNICIRNNVLFASTLTYPHKAVGIIVFEGNNPVITGNTIYASLKGIDLIRCDKAIIAGNNIVAGWIGVSLLGTHSTLYHNRVSGNFWTGILIDSVWNTDNDFYSNSNAVLANTINGENAPGSIGILLVEYTSENLVTLNRIQNVETEILDKGTNIVIGNS